MRPPAMSSPYLRQMTVPEIIGGAFRLYRDHLALLVMVAMVPYLVLLGLNYLFMPGGGGDPQQASPYQSFGISLFILSAILTEAFVMLSVTLAISKAALGEEPGMMEVYRYALRANLASVAGAYFISSMVVAMGLLLLIFPGLILGGLFAPLVPILGLERRSILSGLARSIAMIRGDLLSGIVVFVFFNAIAGALPLLLFSFQAQTGLSPFTPLLNTIIRAVTLPLGFSANVLLFYSLRSGEEGGYGPGMLAAEIGDADPE